MSPCPRCGCNAAELIGVGQRRGEPWALYRCDACSKEFYEGSGRTNDSAMQETVREKPVRCPRCNSTNVPSTGSRVKGSTRVRNRKCKNCHYTFKSTLEESAANAQDGG